jgi:hypothetical protein
LQSVYLPSLKDINLTLMHLSNTSGII